MTRGCARLGDSKTSPDRTDRLHPLQRAVWRALAPYRKRRINVAFSGGNDSTALLSVIASLREPLGLRVRALHVNHDWTLESSAWEKHCEKFCRHLHLPFKSFTLKWRDESGPRGNPGKFGEARAREQRYQWFASVYGVEDLLVTAHHLEDQGETLILRLMRGSAIRGLGAMRPAQSLTASWCSDRWGAQGSIAGMGGRTTLISSAMALILMRPTIGICCAGRSSRFFSRVGPTLSTRWPRVDIFRRSNRSWTAWLRRILLNANCRVEKRTLGSRVGL